MRVLTEIPMNCLCPRRIFPLLLPLLHAPSCNLCHLGVGSNLGVDGILDKARSDTLGVIMTLDHPPVPHPSK